MEDGREIYDDEIEDTCVPVNSKMSGRGQKRKARVAAQPGAKGNIRNFLEAMPAKKKKVSQTPKYNVLSEKTLARLGEILFKVNLSLKFT